jgi:hypothetical protein
MDTLAASDRVFQVWGYTVGMARLLLRSTKTPTFGSRIDVLFQNVRAVKLPTRLDGVVVRGTSEYERASIEADAGIIADEQIHIFILEGASYSGYVVAGTMVVDERDAEYNDPSTLIDGM